MVAVAWWVPRDHRPLPVMVMLPHGDHWTPRGADIMLKGPFSQPTWQLQPSSTHWCALSFAGSWEGAGRG